MGSQYLLKSDTVDWTMQTRGGQSCIRGLRHNRVTIDTAKLVSPPQSGQVKLLGPGFSYTAKSDFQGQDSFTIQVSGMLDGIRGSSDIKIIVSVGPKSPSSPSTANPSPSPALSPTPSPIPSFSTSRSPSPSPATTADCIHKVWQNLEACGWPGPKNTGYPAGTALRVTSGRKITVEGTIADGEKITGALVIAAKNVTIRNSWIISNFSSKGTGRALNGTGVISIEPGASATIDHCTLDGSNATHAGIWHSGHSLVATNNNIYGINDGIFSWPTSGDSDAGNNFTIQDNYLHDFTTLAANGHIDGYQTEGASNGLIRHNVFYITPGQNAAVAIWNSLRSSDNILVDNNLAAGSGFLIYAEDYHPSEQSPAGGFSVTNIRHTNNKFSNALYPCAGYWGVWYPRGSPTDGWNRTGNTILETGENVDNGNPHVGGRQCN